MIIDVKHAQHLIFNDFQIRHTNTHMTTSGTMDGCFSIGVPNVSQDKSSYSQVEIPCGGRACARCGKCRDWYWTPYSLFFLDKKAYMKRIDSTCTAGWGGIYDSQYDCDCCFGGGSYYHLFCGWCCFGRHCECEDNQS
jgi:hypothetical protein